MPDLLDAFPEITAARAELAAMSNAALVQRLAAIENEFAEIEARLFKERERLELVLEVVGKRWGDDV